MQKRKAMETVAIQRCMIRNWGSDHPFAPGDNNTRHNDTRQDDCFIGSDATLETLIMANQSLEALEAESEEWAAYRASAKSETDMNLHQKAHQECATEFVTSEGYSTTFSNKEEPDHGHSHGRARSTTYLNEGKGESGRSNTLDNPFPPYT